MYVATYVCIVKTAVLFWHKLTKKNREKQKDGTKFEMNLCVEATQQF